MTFRRIAVLLGSLVLVACSSDEPVGTGGDVATVDSQNGDGAIGLDFGDQGGGGDDGASDSSTADLTADAPTEDGATSLDARGDAVEDTAGADATADTPAVDTNDDPRQDGGIGTCEEPEFSCCSGNLEAEPICVDGDPTCPDGFRRARPGTCGIIQLRCDIDDCGESQWCDFADNRCLPNDIPISTSMCAVRPLDCGDPPSEPVCGCDGEVYDTTCEANMAGFDTWIDGDCELPSENHFQCGDHFCDNRFQYCRVFGSDVGGFPSIFTCVTVGDDQCPDGINCACLDGEICSDLCIEDDSDGGGVRLICPGG